jgi:uncharacterized protein (TIGR02145 family)
MNLRNGIFMGLLMSLLLTSGLAHSQGVGIGTSAPSSAAILELKSSNQGFLLPRIVDTTRISKPEAGLLVFSLSDNSLYFYAGTNWLKLASNYGVTFIYNGALVTYGTLVSPTTGRTWLDRNLGAQQAAISSTDYLGYGDLFQWGRPADGHQLITRTSSTSGTPVNGTTSTLSSTDVPANSLFILFNAPPGDWKSNQDDSLWQGAGGVNNPCPTGWRVPTELEWKNEIAVAWRGNAPTGGIADINTGYNLLKLTQPGTRNLGGSLVDIGIKAYYWSSTVYHAGVSLSVQFDGGNTYYDFYYRTFGMSVRCIR